MGFRFDPSDEELIMFLRLQGNGDPLPWNDVIYKNLYGPGSAPWVVFSGGAHCYWHSKTEGGATNSTTFVFTKLIRFANSRRILRTSGGGTWSAQSSPKKIFSSETSEIVGFMRMLSFKNPDSGGRSLDFGHWIMHEYSRSDKTAAADLVVCKITRSVKNLGRSRPQPQLFSPMISDGGRSAECKHDPTKGCGRMLCPRTQGAETLRRWLCCRGAAAALVFPDDCSCQRCQLGGREARRRRQLPR